MLKILHILPLQNLNQRCSYLYPVLNKYVHDYDKNSKPGFIDQYKLFKKFCNNNKITIRNSLPFAKYVISLCEKIAR